MLEGFGLSKKKEVTEKSMIQIMSVHFKTTNQISFHPTACNTQRTSLSSHLASLRVQSFARLFSCLIRFDGESNCLARAPPWLILKVHFNLVLADGNDLLAAVVVVGSVEWEF